MPDISPADIWFDPRQILPAAKNALMYPVTHPAQTAEFALSMAPGSGEAMSAVDAWNASGRAGNALLSGNYGQAAGEYGNVLLGALGAIPGAGVIARGTKRGAAWMDRNLPAGVNRLLDAAMPKDAGRTMFSGVGPTADLPMDEASRMARAREMGFDPETTYYHGTAGPHQSLDSSYEGQVSSGDGRGIWLTEDKQYANEYAQRAAHQRDEDPRIIEAHVRTQKPLVVNFDDNFKPLVNGESMDFESNSDVVDYAMKHGFDSVRWPDGSFTDAPSVTVFHGRNVRDKTAAFDPKRSRDAALLASMAGAAIAPAYFSRGYNNEEPR